MGEDQSFGNESRSGVLQPMSDAHKMAFTALNLSTAPVWLAMVLFPRARLTAWLARRATYALAGLGLTYVTLLGVAVVASDERIDISDPDSLRRGLTNPTGFLAGWTHYLAFDLMVGRWIWRSNLDEGRTARLPLVLTWWFGPAGLTLELARRARRARRSA
ncbi:MAG: ABA4-like family protein [Acidimicrobiales bacterium]|nr:ABA4-like family protein [Acidimicrobiales bacterium]